jgi:hypothetical protein
MYVEKIPATAQETFQLIKQLVAIKPNFTLH